MPSYYSHQPTNMTHPLALALESLDGLSIGDAFGQCFFLIADPAAAISSRQLPEAPWFFTDDTEMSLSVLASLAKFGAINQTFLAESIAQHYDYNRAYGPSMHRVLGRIRAGEAWQQVAASSFEGQGSWGNGAAMRAAPIGVYFADDTAMVVQQAALSAEITHAHPEGIAGAIAIALAAAFAQRARNTAQRPSQQEFLHSIIELLPSSEVRSRLLRASEIARPTSLSFAISLLGNGSQMSAQDTVPFALWCCSLYLDDFQEALWLAVSAGGDRDTLCAMVGGVVAAYVGMAGIPETWRQRREVLPNWHRLDTLLAVSDGLEH